MFVRVEIATNAVTKALTIPADAIIAGEASPRVFVVEDAVARLRPITLGIRSGDRCQVVQGLKEGDTIVSFGQKDLKDGAKVLVK